MVNLSRTFLYTEYQSSTSPSEFQTSEPIGSSYSIAHVDKDKNRLHIIEHLADPFGEAKSQMWGFDIYVEDWNSVSKLLESLRKFKTFPDDMSLSMEMSAENVRVRETKHYDDDLEYDEESFEEVDVGIHVSDSTIEFGLRPEPDDPIFPKIPVGDEISLEGGSSNEINLNRFIEMLEIAENNLKFEDKSPDSILTDDLHKILTSTEHGHEVIKHVQDGDICMEKDLLHLALNSYIHAIEWAAITYLKENGKDIIEEEKNGNLYYFALGKNNILNELDKYADIDQKMMGRIKSMNRAERRWMAHHKTGDVLPEEVEAIRARLETLLQDLFL